MNISRLLFFTIIMTFIVFSLSEISPLEKKRKKRRRLRRLERLKIQVLHNNNINNITGLTFNNKYGTPGSDIQSSNPDYERLLRKIRRRNKKHRQKRNKNRRKRRERRKHKIHRQDLESLMSSPTDLETPKLDNQDFGNDKQQRLEKQLEKDFKLNTKQKRHKKRSNSNGNDKSSKRLRRRDRLLQLPTRHRIYDVQGIPVGAIDPPLCPPSVGPATSQSCVVPTCTTHRQCGKSLACCFNGCVHTCTTPMDRPPVIDWIEDTSDVKPIFDVADDVPILPDVYKESNLYASTGQDDSVRLPGGCTISATQYQELKDFMKGPYIENCLCTGGEVACSVKPYKMTPTADGSR